MDLKGILIASKGKVVSGEMIAGKLGISRIAVWKKIRSLKKEGFDIRPIKNKGYILRKPPDILDIGRLEKHLRDSRAENFFGGIKYFYKIDSTQTLAKKLAESSAIKNLIILAEKQSTSYGRLGRKWISNEGGLWISILLKPRLMPQAATLLTLIFSLAVRETVQAYTDKKLYVKWPNDIYAVGKKICGILTELSAELDATRWVVIGAGLNVNNRVPEKLKRIAITLERLAGRKLDRTGILIEILDNFRRRYDYFIKNGFNDFRAEYRSNSIWLNKSVKVKTTDGRSFSGKNIGINENGFLILSVKGKETIIPSGDLFKG